MAQTYAQSCDKSDYFMIITNKILTWREPNKFPNAILDEFQRVVSICFIQHCGRTDRDFEEVAFNVQKGNINVSR